MSRRKYVRKYVRNYVRKYVRNYTGNRDVRAAMVVYGD